MNRKMSIQSALIAAALGLTGCVVGPDFTKPELEIPAEFVEASVETTTVTPDLAEWWRGFEDPVLEKLIEEALVANDDLRIAVVNLREARALSSSARTEWLPDASLSGGHTYNRQSLTSPAAEAAGVGSTLSKSAYDRNSDYYDIGFDASWEADIFGRVRRTVEAGDAALLASYENINDVQVSLIAELATTYIRLREQQVRVKLNERLLDSQRKSVELTHVLYDQGAGSLLDVELGEAQVASREAILPLLRATETQFATQISVLTAQPLAQVRAIIGESHTLPTLPFDGSHAGAPADLLRRRPDLRFAEQQLHESVARIGIAEADLYPRFTLSGSLGWSATEPGNFDPSDSLLGSFGPRVSWAFLNIPEVKQRVEAADARAEVSLIRYQKTLRLAVAEVERSFASWKEEELRLAVLDRSVTSYRNAYELSQQRYKEGAQSYLDLLNVERQLLDAENSLASSDANRTINAISAYKALGGGWHPEPVAELEINQDE